MSIGSAEDWISPAEEGPAIEVSEIFKTRPRGPDSPARRGSGTPEPHTMADVACNEDLILLGIEAATHEDAIRALSQRLEQGGYVRPTFAEAVIAREKTFPTGPPTHPPVATPHTAGAPRRKAAVAVPTFRTPVGFQAMGHGGELQMGIVFLLSITNPQA